MMVTATTPTTPLYHLMLLARTHNSSLLLLPERPLSDKLAYKTPDILRTFKLARPTREESL